MTPLSPSLGRAILRKHDGPVPTDIVDVAARAVVEVTSEEELYPIDHVFDGRDGPGGSCWIASSTGPQSIVLRFHRPLLLLGSVVIESEERSDTCSQHVEIAGWCDASARPFEGAARLFDYAPYKTSFHRSEWRFRERAVSHLCVRVTPGPPGRHASLTAIVLREVPV